MRRSGQLRQRLESELQVLHPVLTWADRLQDAWFWVRNNPVSVMAGAAALVFWRPRRAFGLSLRLWSVWRLLRRANALRSAFAPHR